MQTQHAKLGFFLLSITRKKHKKREKKSNRVVNFKTNDKKKKITVNT